MQVEEPPVLFTVFPWLTRLPRDSRTDPLSHRVARRSRHMLSATFTTEPPFVKPHSFELLMQPIEEQLKILLGLVPITDWNDDMLCEQAGV